MTPDTPTTPTRTLKDEQAIERLRGLLEEALTNAGHRHYTPELLETFRLDAEALAHVISRMSDLLAALSAPNRLEIVQQLRRQALCDHRDPSWNDREKVFHCSECGIVGPGSLDETAIDRLIAALSAPSEKNDDKAFARLAPAPAVAPESLTNATTTEVVSDGKHYDASLDVTIEHGALVVRIGVKTLAHAVTYSDWANPYDENVQDYIRTFAIEDAHEFAKDVMRAMEHEAEDGSSPLTRFIDKASEDAVNDGSLGLHEDFDHKIKHGEKSPLETW
jgi:hypothetical protein